MFCPRIENGRTINNVGVDLLLDDGVHLDDASHVGGAGLIYVLLNVMHDVLVYFTVEHGLHLCNLVVSDALLYDWSTE
jgi:hypothetical protein